MTQSPDEPTATPQTSNLDTADQSFYEKPGLWRRFMNLSFHMPAVLFLAFVMVPFGALVSYWADPSLPVTVYIMQGIGSAWTGPLILIVALMAMKSIRPIRTISDRMADRRALRASSVIISMLAARTRYYESVGNSDPSKAAALDVAAAVDQQVPPEVTALWVTEALDWWENNGVDQLPPFPRRLESLHKRFSGMFSD